MENHLFFIAGVHGVGKGTLCKEFAKRLPADHLVASDLIRKKRDLNNSKIVTKALSNQEILLEEFKKHDSSFPYILLDGHSCLLDSNKNLIKLPIDLFKELKIKKILLLISEPELIHKRLIQRDGDKAILTVKDLSLLQQAEKEHSKFISKELDIPFIEFDTSKDTEQAFLEQLIQDLKG
ncbi:ATP-binding protein [Acinetobacter sp. ESBL14]|uniref:ATP-binding protein n=1 Tax=Acinetobacter sp. ESBL14 TaxID=3077329 RepID=UPI002FCAEBCE